MAFALFGFGRFGKNYARLLREVKGARLKSVVVRTPRSVAASRTVLPESVEVTTDAGSVMRDPAIQCVIIATPPATHYAIAEIALAAGKHVLLEKPMTTNLRDARRLAQRAKKSQRVFMVGFQYVYNDSLRFLKRAIDAGKLGMIQSIVAEHYVSPKRSDVSCLWDASPHALSIFQHFFAPKRVVSVAGKQGRDSWDAAIIFDRGPVLHWIGSSQGVEKTRRITFVSDAARVIFDEVGQKNPLVIERAGKPPVFPKSSGREPLKNEVEHFISCIRKKAAPVTDAAFGYKITQWLNAIDDAL